MGRVARTVAVVAHGHGDLPARDRLGHDRSRLAGSGIGAPGEVLADAPHEVVHVVGDLVRQRLVAVGHHVYGGSHVGDVGPGISEEHAHVGVVLARLPAPGPLHDVHRGRLAGPLQHGRSDDAGLAGGGRGRVFTSGRQPQGTRRALPLDVGVVVGEALGDEGEVGVLEELAVLVPVQVEAAGDGHVRSDHLAETPGDLGLRPGHLAHRHGAVQRQVDAVHGELRPQLGEHDVHEVVEGRLRVPAPRRPAEHPEGRRERHQLDIPELARPFRESAQVGARRQQRLPRDRLADAQPVLDLGVAAGAEGAGLVLEGGHGDAQSLRFPGVTGAGGKKEGRSRQQSHGHAAAGRRRRLAECVKLSDQAVHRPTRRTGFPRPGDR